MTVRKAETVYLGDASSVVKAAAAAQKANADYAAKTKASAEQIIAAQDKIAASADRATKAAVAAGDSRARAAAIAGRAAMDEAKAVGASTAEQVAAYRKATAAAESAYSRQVAAQKKATVSLSGMSSSLQKATKPILAIGAVSAYSAVQFQKNMELIHTQAGGSTAELERMSKAVLNLGMSTEQGPQKLAQALYPIESVGLRGRDAIQALAAASKGAAVGGSDLTETTHALAGVMVALHENGSKAQQTMAAIDATVGVGKMTMQDFVMALSSGIVPTAAAVGLSFRSLAAGLATMTDAGVPAEQAATKMRTILLMLADEHTKAAVANLQSIGLTSDDLAAAMRRPGNGLLDVLQLLHDRLNGLNKVQQTDILSSLAGGSRSAGTLITLEQQLGRVGTKYKSISQLTGQFNSRVAAESETASHRIKVAWSQVQVAGIELGQMLAPVVGTIASSVSGVVKAFMSLPQAAQHAIVTGGLILAGLGPALKIVEVFSTSVGRMWQVAQLITGAKVLNLPGRLGGAGGSVSAAAGSAEGAVVSGAPGAATAGLFARVASRAVGGLAVGGLGVMIAQTVGSAIHGSVGSAIKTIGTDTAIGAGVGSLFGPAGTIGGAMIGGLVGSFQHFIGDDAARQGQEFAKQFTSSLPSEVSKRTTEALAKATTRAKIASTPPLVHAAGSTGGRMSGLSGSSTFTRGAVNSKAEFDAFFNQGYAAGQAVIAGLRGVRTPTTAILFADFMDKLKQLPAQARPEAARLMVEYAHGLEANKELPKGAVDSIISRMEDAFPAFRSYLRDQGLASDSDFAKALKFTNAMNSLRATVAAFRTQYGDVAISAKLTNSNIVSNASKAMDDLHGVIVTSTGKTRADAQSEYNHMSQDVQSTFSTMATKVASTAADMGRSISDGSSAASADAAQNFDQLQQNVTRAMNAGILNTTKGSQFIAQALDATLKAFGRKPIPVNLALEQLSVSGATKTFSGAKEYQNIARTAAAGYIGYPGERGADNVPIIVGRGEAILNHHQQGVVNAALGAVGINGLPGLFSKVKGSHSVGSVKAPGVLGTGTLATLVRMALGKEASAANMYLSSHVGGSGGSGAPSGATGPVPAGTVRDWLTRALKITNHYSPANLAALYSRTMQESGGNPHAINLWDSNAKAGHPSKGLLQTIDSTFSSYMLPGMGDIWNPVDNAVAALRYMFARYGHVVGASSSGYSGGGFAGMLRRGGVASSHPPKIKVPALPKVHVGKHPATHSTAAATHAATQMVKGTGINAILTAAAQFLYPLDEAIAAIAARIQMLQSKGAPNHDKQIGTLTAQLDKIKREKINPPAAHNASEIAGLVHDLAGIAGERLGLPTPARGKAGDAQRAANAKTLKGLAADRLSIEQKIKYLKQEDSNAAAIRRKGLANQTLTIEEKIAKLKAEDKSARTQLADTIKGLNLQSRNLTQLKSYTDAITSLRTQMQGLAQQAAQAWNTQRTNQINSAHAQAIAAVGNSPAAQQLAAMQAQDKVTQNAEQLASLNQAISDAQTAVNQSGGQQHLDALVQLQNAQQALTDYQRQQDEQRLQDQVDAATSAADQTQQTALDSLTQQTTDYQTMLNSQLSALTDNLNARKMTYAKWAKEVNAILAPYGLSAATDSTTEQTVAAGPGPGVSSSSAHSPIRSRPESKTHHKSRRRRHRWTGGPVEPGLIYTVGEQGPEDVMFGAQGHVLNAQQTRNSRGGGTIHIHGDLNIPSYGAAKAMADRLAFKAHVGVA